MQAQIFNAAGNQSARVLPWGNLQVAIEGRAVFSEPFEGTVLDTVNRWNTPVVAGTPVKEITSSVVDGGYHLMGLAVRGDTKYFFLDNLEVPVASVPLLSPTTMNLPIRVHSINHTSGPTVGPTFQITGVQVLDSGGTYPIVFNGQTVSRQRAPNVFKTFSLTSVATETAIWTPAAGKKFRLMGYQLTSGTVGGDVVLKDGTGLATIMTIPFGAAAGSSQTAPPLGNGILSGAINRVLTATGAATQTISGYVFGTEE